MTATDGLCPVCGGRFPFGHYCPGPKGNAVAYYGGSFVKRIEVPYVEIHALCAFVEIELQNATTSVDDDWASTLVKVRAWLDKLDVTT